MEGIFIPLGFFAMVVIIVYLAIRKKERLALIEKGADAKIFISTNRQSNGSLKWGLFLIGIGVGLIIANILVKNYLMGEEAAYFSMIFLFGGIALVISHFMGKKQLKEE